MSIVMVTVDGVEYPIAPMEPELRETPGPAIPMAITPAVATSWLRYNYRNRNQREGGKRDYSSDISSGNFAINGSTITFTRPHRAGEDERVPEGAICILDGQHRLESCRASGKPFVSYVIFGLDPGVRHTIDTGIKRTFGDVLLLRGEHNTIVLASVVKKAYCWDIGDFHLTAKRRSATHTDLSDFLRKHPELRRSAEIASLTYSDFERTTGDPLRRSVVGFAHWLLMQTDETRAPVFFQRLGDGAKMETSDPIMALRQRFVKDLKEKKQNRGETRKTVQNIPDWQQLCYIIRTWNARLVWEGLSEKEQQKYVFSMVGPRDSVTIPAVKTPAQAAKELAALEAKRKAAGK